MYNALSRTGAPRRSRHAPSHGSLRLYRLLGQTDLATRSSNATCSSCRRRSCLYGSGPAALRRRSCREGALRRLPSLLRRSFDLLNCLLISDLSVQLDRIFVYLFGEPSHSRSWTRFSNINILAFFTNSPPVMCRQPIFSNIIYVRDFIDTIVDNPARDSLYPRSVIP